MKVPYLALDRQWKDIRSEALPLIDEVLSTGKYLDHDIVGSLESQLSKMKELIQQMGSRTDYFGKQ